MTVHLVDQHQVAPADVAAFTSLVRDQGVPLMEAAGATFVLCASASDLGEHVHVLSVWSFRYFVQWNEIRRNLMFDLRYVPYPGAFAALPPRGTSRLDAVAVV